MQKFLPHINHKNQLILTSALILFLLFFFGESNAEGTKELPPLINRFCHASYVLTPIGDQVTIWAKGFDASSFDDCAPLDELLFTFTGDSYQPSFTYSCVNVPAFGVELSINIWVADDGTDDNCNDQISWNERNKDFCTTNIVITDNNHVCTDHESLLYEGEILTDDGQSVESVNV